MLKDQETFRAMGIDGIIYEAFEPGIGAFEEQLGKLSRGMLGEHVGHVPSRLEILCQNDEWENTSFRIQALRYLFAPSCENESFLKEEIPMPYRAELAVLIRDFLRDSTFERWEKVARFALAYQNAADAVFISPSDANLRWNANPYHPILSTETSKALLQQNQFISTFMKSDPITVHFSAGLL